MSLSTTINYDTPGTFTYDPVKISVTSDAALKLLVTAQTFTEDFADDTGFTYDNSKAEFVGGVLRQKNTTPTNSQIASTFDSSLDADWRNDGDSNTATLNGVPTLSGGKLSCVGVQGLSYAYTTSAVETHKFIYTPNYTTGPSTNINFWSSHNGTDNKDRLNVINSPSGNNLRLQLYNSSGTNVLGLTAMAGWRPTADQRYEIGINVDSVAGTIRTLIDGVQHSLVSLGAWTRGGVVSKTHLGASTVAYNTADALYNDYIYFDNVQNTAGYTPGYTVSPTKYILNNVTLPEFSHTGVGQILSYTGLQVTEVGTEPRYTIQINKSGSYLYWNGAAWAESDNSYAQANSRADFSANAAALAVGAGIYVQMKVLFTDTNVLTSVDDLILDHTGNSGYDTANPNILVTSGFDSDGLFTFKAAESVTGNDLVQYTICLSGQDKYWDGVAWSDSNVTFAQSNSEADINANLAALDISVGKKIKIRAYLHSDDGTTTPTLTSILTSYSFSAPEVTEPTECVVFSYVRTLLADPHASSISLIVTNEATFYYNNMTVVPPNVQTAVANSSGNVDISLIETATPTTQYKFQIRYIDYLGKTQTVLLGNATVPNQTTVNLASLTFN